MKYSLILLLALLTLGCSSDEKPDLPKSPKLSAASVDDKLADSLIYAFRSKILLDDMTFLVKDSSAYQFYKIDLNNDQEEEIFVRLMSPYYCSTGGCTFMILSPEYEVLNKFTATNAPIIASQEFVNDWRVLITEVEGKMKMLLNKNGHYPSNPAMALDANIPISRDDFYMFDTERAPCKTYFF